MAAQARPLPTDAAVPALGADGGPRLYGSLDVVRPDRVAGWAIDRTDPRAAVEIDVLREGRLVATVRADRMRRDLERGGVGTGRYGFSCELAPPLEPGFEFTVRVVVRAADGARSDLRRTGAQAAAPDPDRRLLERIFEDLQQLRNEPAPTPAADPSDALHEVVRRIELAQIRIEAALGAAEPAPPPAQSGLRAMVALALAAGLGSLALGVVSMWGP